jgi:hypothetical protein
MKGNFVPNHRGIIAKMISLEGTTTPIRWEGVTTPPILSSSPAIAVENMDISPLPHKPPFSLSNKLSRASALDTSESVQVDNILSFDDKTLPQEYVKSIL